jgi:hypothetical protein
MREVGGVISPHGFIFMDTQTLSLVMYQYRVCGVGEKLLTGISNCGRGCETPSSLGG